MNQTATEVGGIDTPCLDELALHFAALRATEAPPHLAALLGGKGVASLVLHAL